MGWQVTSTISGGRRHNAATREEYTAVARMLDDAAASWRTASIAWSTAALQLSRHRVSVPLCPTLASEYANGNGHATLPYGQLIQRCTDHARACRSIGDDLSDLAALLIRAHALYETSESRMTRLMTELLQSVGMAAPAYTAIGAGALTGGGMLFGSAVERRFNPVWGLTSSARAQEGLLGAAASAIAGIGPIRSLLRTDEVNAAAERIAGVSAPLHGLVQGTELHVEEVTTDVAVVGESASVAQSLEHLRRLAEERLGKVDLGSGLDYATIAIQRYRRADGTVGWLVTIPGTDGQDDSPFGWPQNVELMSDSPTRRMNADSARMVVEAMRQAGIGSDEPVALIGHSQGGIVAAAIAADMCDDYTIEHVVTAGSPVANHPIPSSTWVTSIEIDDELVAALDGASNPSTDNWLTIHGYATQTAGSSIDTVNADGSCTPGDTASSWQRGYRAAEVRDAADGKEITHWLKYHQAAYQNATDLGSPAVIEHERHFRQVIDGELEETRYYRGRMMHAGVTTAPSERRIDMDALGDGE
ncbi:alpha/beta hydrolase [Bifidobacterium ramosum]|nr:alpha/beta hydrolase [Bifidobacterium ramosum]NEG71206.1 alpha/beta fold hydrolase [Bifidobacterium ramosum]